MTVALGGDFGKPRPALVVQSDFVPATYRTVTIVPLTSHLEMAPLFRITVEPSRGNGLRKISQVMIDKSMTQLREKLGPPIGHLDEDTLVRVNRALVLWLGLVA